jgi:hypothetical protein
MEHLKVTPGGQGVPSWEQTSALEHVLKVRCVSYNKNSSLGIKDVFNDHFLNNFTSLVRPMRIKYALTN